MGVFCDYAIYLNEVMKIMDQEKDSLRLYKLGTKYSEKIEHYGVQRHLPVDDVMMI